MMDGRMTLKCPNCGKYSAVHPIEFFTPGTTLGAEELTNGVHMCRHCETPINIGVFVSVELIKIKEETVNDNRDNAQSKA